MTEELFLKILEESLMDELPGQEVRQNIQYYRDYIAASRSTKSEDEVMKALGDPRLIAKTIIDTYRLTHDSKRTQTNYETHHSEQADINYQQRGSRRGDKGMNSTFKVVRTASWITTVLILIILFLFFGLVLWIGGVMFKLFLRFFLPLILILIGVNWIRRQFRK